MRAPPGGMTCSRRAGGAELADARGTAGGPGWPGSCATVRMLLPAKGLDMLWATARARILTPLLDTVRAAAGTRTRLDLSMFRDAVGMMVYFATLELVTVAAYALWAGPRRFGVTESWPLVFYFVVPYLGTVLIAFGIIAVFRADRSSRRSY